MFRKSFLQLVKKLKMSKNHKFHLHQTQLNSLEKYPHTRPSMFVYPFASSEKQAKIDVFPSFSFWADSINSTHVAVLEGTNARRVAFWWDKVFQSIDGNRK